MKTITLELKENAYKKLGDWLSQFDNDEARLVESPKEFEAAKKQLHEDYEYMKSPNAKFYSVEESEKFIDFQNELREDLEYIDRPDAEFSTLEELRKSCEEIVKKYEG